MNIKLSVSLSYLASSIIFIELSSIFSVVVPPLWLDVVKVNVFSFASYVNLDIAKKPSGLSYIMLSLSVESFF